MENNMKNFDDLFRDELADHAEVPPSRVWESLEKRLNANAAGGKTAFGKGWYWYVGVASVAMLMGALGWNLAHKSSDGIAPAVVQVTETATPVMEEPSYIPETAVAQRNTKQIAAVQHRAVRSGFHQEMEEQADDISPYGNAAATGTKLHSYDDFDERAIASSQKLTPLNSDEEHAAHGYKMNRVRKNRMMVAEMVPIHQHENVLAASADAPKPAEAAKPVVARRSPARTIAGKLTSNQAPKKTVILVNETGKDENAANETGTDVSSVAAGAADVKAAAVPASSSMPVPAGTATAAKSKPASEVVVPVKPTTGGSEPVKGASAAQQDNTEDGTEEKKGLFSIFKKKKK